MLNLFAVEANRFGLGSDDTMELADVVPVESSDVEAHKYRRYYKQLRIIGADTAVYVRNGTVIASIGRGAPAIELDTSRPRQTEARALSAAIASIAGRGAALAEKSEVVIAYTFADTFFADPRVSYRFVINFASPRAQYVVYVDAYDLSIVRSSRSTASLGPAVANAIADAAPQNILPPLNWRPARARGRTLYNGIVEFDAARAVDPIMGVYYRLDSVETPRVSTKDLNNYLLTGPQQDIYVNATECNVPEATFEDCSSGKCIGNFDRNRCPTLPTVLKAGVSAHWAAQQTLSYYFKTFGLTNYDAGGGVSYLLVNGQPWQQTAQAENAHGVQGGGTQELHFSAPGTSHQESWNHVVSLDAVAHEMSHGVTHEAVLGGLEYRSESGAIDEAFSDIFALLVEGSENGGVIDWKIAEDVYLPGKDCWRNIRNPGRGPGFPNNPSPADPTAGCNGTQFPNTYQGEFYEPEPATCTESNDWCWTHSHSTVVSYWFWLMVNGCVGPSCANNAVPFDVYEVEPIPVENAAAIVYGALRRGTDNQPTFVDFANASTLEAAIKFGPLSREVKAVVNAWHAVNVAAEPYRDPDTIPNDQETDVDPWPTELSFDLGPGYTADSNCLNSFKVLVATSESMSDAVPAGEVEIDIPAMRGKVKVTLLPEKTYYWQIFDPTPDPNLCGTMYSGARNVQMFETAAKETDLLSPTKTSPCVASDKGYIEGTCHPWGLHFDWTPVDGALEYEVEVYKGNTSSDSVLVAAQTSADESIELDVLVKQEQRWRVRARGEETVFGEKENYGPWEQDGFVTGMPTTDAVSPNGQIQHPWKLMHEWDPVVGADHYVFTLHAMWDDEGDFDYVISPTVKAEYEVNLRAKPIYRDRYWWEVELWGPVLPILGYAEKGETYYSTDYTTDGSKTTAWLEDPNWQQVGNDHPQCKQQGDQKVTFKTVEAAVAYEINFYAAICVLGEPCYQGELARSERWAHTSGSSMAVNVEDINAPIVGGNDAIGYYVQTITEGPENLKGIPHTELYWVQPEGPSIDFPSDGMGHLYRDAPLRIRWYSPLAHGGGFVLEVHEGGRCNSPHSEHVIDGFSPGYTETLYSVNFGWLSGTSTRSFRVRPFIYDGCDWPRYSECIAFQIHNENKPRPQTPEEIAEMHCSEICYNTCPFGGCPGFCTAICGKVCGCAVLNGADVSNGRLNDIPPSCCYELEPVVDEGRRDCQCPPGAG